MAACLVIVGGGLLVAAWPAYRWVRCGASPDGALALLWTLAMWSLPPIPLSDSHPWLAFGWCQLGLLGMLVPPRFRRMATAMWLLEAITLASFGLVVVGTIVTAQVSGAAPLPQHERDQVFRGFSTVLALGGLVGWTALCIFVVVTLGRHWTRVDSRPEDAWL